MVLREYIGRQSAHVQRREDFLFLQTQAQTAEAARLYQRLIQEFPDLNDLTLADDLQRTGMLVDPKTPHNENLIWKYHISLRNELQNRAERRVNRALQAAEK
jgi:hypothetical protein